MKRLVTVLALVCGCASDTGRVDFDPDDVTYHQDERTGLCFAAVGSESAMSLSSSGLGMSQVDCTEKVLALIGK